MSAIVMGAIAAAGAVVGVVRENSAATAELQQFGRHAAAVEMKRQDRQQDLVGTAYAVAENNQMQKLMLEQSAQADAASQQVAAAASGTEGQSVDLGQIEVEAATGRAMGATEKNLQNQLRNIEAASRSVNIEADAELIDFEPRDTKGQLAGVFLSGLQGYIGAGGFGL